MQSLARACARADTLCLQVRFTKLTKANISSISVIWGNVVVRLAFTKLPCRAALAFAGVLAMLAPLAAASQSVDASVQPANAALIPTLCSDLGHVTVHNHRHVRFVVRNDNFGGRSECLKNHAMMPNFKVTRSAADAHGPESLAFPDIFIGCNWGICSPDTTLPARVSRVRRAETSWYTRQRASGIWNVAYDIWFNKTPITSGQANGAEIMIWLNAHHFPPPRWAPIVWEDHARYYFVHWRPYRHGVSWNYMQFRRVHPARSVTHLRLEPFMQTAERMGLLKPRWYLLNIEAGFEIWSGGRGLATNWFWARS